MGRWVQDFEIKKSGDRAVSNNSKTAATIREANELGPCHDDFVHALVTQPSVCN
jgi:hypothetical protein